MLVRTDYVCVRPTMIEVNDAIGFQLRSAREAAGLSLHDVEFQTQLPLKVLIALESEDFSIFVSPLYAKSFLTQYSEFIGVDATLWIDAIEPGQFIPNDGIGTILEGPVEPELVSAPIPTSAGRARSGWLAVFGLLAVSVGVVVAAIKGYAAFEKRFAGEPPASAINPDLGTPEAPATLPPKTFAPESETSFVTPRNNKTTAGENEETSLAQPPPRAIIVR